MFLLFCVFSKCQAEIFNLFCHALFVVLILNTGGEGLKHSLHIPGIYFKRFLPVSNLVSLDFSRKCWVTFSR